MPIHFAGLHFAGLHFAGFYLAGLYCADPYCTDLRWPTPDCTVPAPPFTLGRCFPQRVPAGPPLDHTLGRIISRSGLLLTRMKNDPTTPAIPNIANTK